MASTPFRWLLIVLVPLVPVIALYLLFEQQNYFQLDDPSRGLFIVGPIGAYFLLVLVGSRIFLKLPTSPSLPREVVDKLCGEWVFESISLNNHVRSGDCTIESKNGELILTGNFKEAGKAVGHWRGEIAGVRDNNFLLVYSLQQVGPPGHVYGLVQIPLIDSSRSRLEGTWNVVGREGQEGTIIYTRKARKAA